MNAVTIKFALNGFVARIGCQRVVFTDREKMLAELEAYLKNPEEVRKKYLYNSMHSDLMGYGDITSQGLPDPAANDDED